MASHLYCSSCFGRQNLSIHVLQPNSTFLTELNSRGKPAPGHQQKRILTIDDDQDVSMTLSVVLEENGFRTDSFTNPALAYHKLFGSLYDLVLLDIKMPEVNGFHFYRKIRKIDARVKICFLTASEFYNERYRKEHGFADFKQNLFLRKPIETKDLVHEINKLLESD